MSDGLHFLISFDCSDYMVALQGNEVPLSGRLECIDSMAVLFRDCFDVRLPHRPTSHWGELGGSPLNFVCGMWWDILPLHYLAGYPNRPDGEEVDLRILSVIEKNLSLKSDTCIDSSLYGLIGSHYPERRQQITEDFVRNNPNFASRWIPTKYQ